MSPSPSLGPPLLSPSWSPPPPWGIPPDVVVVVGGGGGGGGGGDVVGVVVGGGGGGAVVGVAGEGDGDGVGAAAADGGGGEAAGPGPGAGCEAGPADPLGPGAAGPAPAALLDGAGAFVVGVEDGAAAVAAGEPVDAVAAFTERCGEDPDPETATATTATIAATTTPTTTGVRLSMAGSCRSASARRRAALPVLRASPRRGLPRGADRAPDADVPPTRAGGTSALRAAAWGPRPRRLQALAQLGQELGVLGHDGLEVARVEAEHGQDRRGDLGGVHLVGHGGATGAVDQVGALDHEHGHMGVVRREPAVLGHLGAARAVDGAREGLDDDVGRPGVHRRVAPLLGQAGPRVDLHDPGGVGALLVGLERLDGRLGLALIGQPDEGDVIVGRLGDVDPGVGQDS